MLFLSGVSIAFGVRSCVSLALCVCDAWRMVGFVFDFDFYLLSFNCISAVDLFVSL